MEKSSIEEERLDERAEINDSKITLFTNEGDEIEVEFEVEFEEEKQA
jgi:uncharacterized protein YxeA